MDHVPGRVFPDRVMREETPAHRAAVSRLEDMPAMDRLAHWLPTHLPPDDAPACIAHGDYRLGNVLIHPTEPRVVAVLDWELATIGNPLADLGYFCLTYHVPPGPSARGGVAAKYRERYRDIAKTGWALAQRLSASG